MTEIELPNGYIPYDEMIICGNTLRNAKATILVDNRPVFLIGKGRPPPIWLQLPSGEEWHYEITNRRINDTAFKIQDSKNAFSIYFGHNLIIRAEIKSETTLSIDHIDLTKFGLSIYGNPSSLHVGGGSYSGNYFDGAFAMVNVG